MTPEFTTEELKTICLWAMDAATRARKMLSYYPEPYNMANAIFEKASDECGNRMKAGE